DQRAAGHMGAAAIAAEADAVVAALDVVADDLAGRERCLAVRAAVGERGSNAVLAAEEHHRLVTDRSRHGLDAELGRCRGVAPLIAPERAHLVPPRPRSILAPPPS